VVGSAGFRPWPNGLKPHYQPQVICPATGRDQKVTSARPWRGILTYFEKIFVIRVGFSTVLGSTSIESKKLDTEQPLGGIRGLAHALGRRRSRHLVNGEAGNRLAGYRVSPPAYRVGGLWARSTYTIPFLPSASTRSAARERGESAGKLLDQRLWPATMRGEPTRKSGTRSRGLLLLAHRRNQAERAGQVARITPFSVGPCSGCLLIWRSAGIEPGTAP
jgi:hypothetical protein